MESLEGPIRQRGSSEEDFVPQEPQQDGEDGGCDRGCRPQIPSARTRVLGRRPRPNPRYADEHEGASSEEQSPQPRGDPQYLRRAKSPSGPDPQRVREEEDQRCRQAPECEGRGDESVCQQANPGQEGSPAQPGRG